MVRTLLECILVSQASVIPSVHWGGGLPLSPGGVHTPLDTPPDTPTWTHTHTWTPSSHTHNLDTPHGQQAGGTHPTGIFSCL